MLKVITLFTGIGAQEAALKRLNIPYEVVGISEIDKYAIQSYEAINGSTRNYGDITKIDALDYADLWTYSSPCQDFSTAGKQAGIRNSDGSLTRSGLLLHVERLLTDSVIRGDQPKYLLMENVKGLVTKKFKPDFDRWLERLEQLGYNNYWQVLNAKDYGVPQNRERVFVVSIRKDVDVNGYKFPEKIPLVKKLKDVLENEVDEKYYLSDMQINSFRTSNYNQNRARLQEKDVCQTLCARDWKDPKLVSEPIACASRGRNPDNPSDRTVGIPTEQHLKLRKDGCTNTLTTVQKDNYVIEPKIIQVGNIVQTDSFGGNPQRGRVYSAEGCSPALNTMQGGGLEPKIITHNIPQKVIVRKYEVDTNKLVETLRLHKQILGLTNNQIANNLNTPLTLVEHWFRQDSSFAIPSADIWFKLKDLLCITTDEFDLSITEFEEKDGVFEKANRCYGVDGLAPTLTSTSADEKVITDYRIRKLTPRECWRLMGFTDVEFDCAQMSGNSNSQLYKQAGNSIVVDVLACIFRELFNDRP